MPTFIKRKTKQIDHGDYVEVVRVNYTKAELKELRENEPSKFITVSESHAAGVIRPQDNYQEVPDAEDKTATHVSRPADTGGAGPSQVGHSGSGRSAKGSNGNGNRR